MNATPYAGTPEHIRTAGNIIVETSAASAQAPVENAGPVSSFALARGWVPVSSAEALADAWCDEAKNLQQTSARVSDTNLKLRIAAQADVLWSCAGRLRRHREAASVRQPAPNNRGDTDALLPNSK